MPKSLIFFEDDGFKNLYPLTLTRPSYFLRSGARQLYRNFMDLFGDYNPYFYCRREIEDIVAEKVDIPVNSFNGRHGDETIFLNGRLKPDNRLVEALKLVNGSVVIVSNDLDIAAIKIVGKLSDDQFQDLINGDLPAFVKKASDFYEKMSIEVPAYTYLWDFVNDIHHSLNMDYGYYLQNESNGFRSPDPLEYQGASLINPEKILINDNVVLMPGTVIDASHGPIILDKNAKVEPNTYLIGPSYIGPDSILVGGKIDACSVGPVCRIGGELEESVIQGYTNKYHAGFVGHSYVGQWVNFGAMTTNSDLKNNYKEITVAVNGQSVNTGSIKIGSFIGDYTRTAIGTLLNTGINIGVSCNILGGSLVTEREIDSFTWYTPDASMPYKYDKAIETIETAMGRRKVKLGKALNRRLKSISEGKL